MGYRAGDTYSGNLAVYVSGGGSGEPDATPIVSTVIHTPAGSTPAEDNTFGAALTVGAPLVTNSYNYPVYGTIPSGYSGGDTFVVLMYYTISGTPIYVPLAAVVVDRLPAFPRNKAMTGFPLFMPLSNTNGQTPGTSLAVTAQRRLDNSAIATCTGTATMTDANGNSVFTPAAADTNGAVGEWIFSAAGCDTQRFFFATAP